MMPMMVMVVISPVVAMSPTIMTMRVVVLFGAFADASIGRACIHRWSISVLNCIALPLSVGMFTPTRIIPRATMTRVVSTFHVLVRILLLNWWWRGHRIFHSFLRNIVCAFRRLAVGCFRLNRNHASLLGVQIDNPTTALLVQIKPGHLCLQRL